MGRVGPVDWTHHYTPYTFYGLDTVESWGSPATVMAKLTAMPPGPEHPGGMAMPPGPRRPDGMARPPAPHRPGGMAKPPGPQHPGGMAMPPPPPPAGTK